MSLELFLDQHASRLRRGFAAKSFCKRQLCPPIHPRFAATMRNHHRERYRSRPTPRLAAKRICPSKSLNNSCAESYQIDQVKVFSCAHQKRPSPGSVIIQNPTLKKGTNGEIGTAERRYRPAAPNSSSSSSVALSTTLYSHF